jgi:hypothetical protein
VLAAFASALLHAVLLERAAKHPRKATAASYGVHVFAARLAPPALPEPPAERQAAAAQPASSGEIGSGERNSAAHLPQAGARAPVRRFAAAPPSEVLAQPAPEPAPSTLAGVNGPDETHYSARDLDVYPALLSAIDALETTGTGQPFSGRLLVEARIDERGMVTRLVLLQTDADGWGERMLDALSRARFTPAEKRGRPVRSELILEITYGLPPPHATSLGPPMHRQE